MKAAVQRGGGLDLAEGSTVEDFPPKVTEQCTATAVWLASPTPLEVMDDSP